MITGHFLFDVKNQLLKKFNKHRYNTLPKKSTQSTELYTRLEQ